MSENSTENISTAETELALFQEALLDLLASSLPPTEMMRRLAADAVFAPYRSYTATFELRMVEVAAALTKKWGRREAGTPIIEEPSSDTVD